MANNRPQNIYERQKNKKAIAKKERAKAKHFGVSLTSHENTDPQIVGWDDFTEEKESGDEVSGILVETKWWVFHVLYWDNTVPCQLDKKIPFQLGRSLVVGDKIHLEIEDNQGVIKSRWKRENWIARMKRDSTKFSAYQQSEQIVAVNIDVGVIVATTINPLFHANFIDRYLIIMQNGWVTPLICLNKCDLTNERSPMLNYYKNELKIDVVEISATTGQWISDLRDALQDKLAVLVGNSGVGKTSIINALQDWLKLKTQEVSSKHKEWKHTTTTTALHTWWPNSHIIDTPGIRSLEVDHIDKNELRYFFPEFEKYMSACKYNDCIHEHEPLSDCAVKKAVEDWDINRSRYESYVRMLEDLN